MTRRRIAALGIAALLVTLSACTAAPQEAGERPAHAAPAEAASPPPRRPAERRPAAAPASKFRLDAKWFVDSNGNVVPDFVEVELGQDPATDSCVKGLDCPGPAQGAGFELVEQTRNVLLVLDASGSMAGPAGGGQTKMQAARAALERYVVGTPDELVRLGFMVYGHRGSNQEQDKAVSCDGVELLAPLGAVRHDTFPQLLEQFQPTGFTPIAGALHATHTAFAGQEGADNRVILVSDGIETCDGDPVAAARALAEAGVKVTVDVVGFDVADAEVAQLRQIAEVTGGTYTPVRTGGELEDYFRRQYELQAQLTEQIVCMFRHALDVSGCYARLSTQMTEKIREYELAAGSVEEREAIYDVRVAVQEHLTAARVRVREDTAATRQKVEAARDAVQERLRARYREELSFEPCAPPHLRGRVLA